MLNWPLNIKSSLFQDKQYDLISGNTISIQPAGTPTILVPGPIMTTTSTTHVTTNLLVSDPSTSNVLHSSVPNMPSTSSTSVSTATPKKRKRK